MHALIRFVVSNLAAQQQVRCESITTHCITRKCETSISNALDAGVDCNFVDVLFFIVGARLSLWFVYGIFGFRVAVTNRESIWLRGCVDTVAHMAATTRGKYTRKFDYVRVRRGTENQIAGNHWKRSISNLMWLSSFTLCGRVAPVLKTIALRNLRALAAVHWFHWFVKCGHLSGQTNCMSRCERRSQFTQSKYWIQNEWKYKYYLGECNCVAFCLFFPQISLESRARTCYFFHTRILT